MASSSDIIGLDVGEKRVGVARTSPIAKLPEPLCILDNNDDIFEQVEKVITQYSAKDVVVGVPHNMSGQETAQSQVCYDFAKNLQQHLGDSYTVTTIDESLSSVTARSRKPNQKHIDDVAAAVILENYLEAYVR